MQPIYFSFLKYVTGNIQNIKSDFRDNPTQVFNF